MTNTTYKKQMDKVLKGFDFERFLVLFGQYSINPDKDIVFYKTIVMVYYLSIQNFSKFYLLIQSCANEYEKYVFALEVYESIRTCNIKSIEDQIKDSDKIFKKLLQQIKENIINSNKLTKNNVANEESLLKTNNVDNNIADCCFIVKNFKR
ncbi:hypothetical protein EHP00_685 [Ecytonucleospora hepatopenaei]|uniref:Uncharacterized protein n=1 Tax=Ecytonucleospora hepatopenaei TaxID=646526 RepID=A0A1W0E3Q9_9MICR|nr:hypothetical protein EHP00_685 [Ecytonucleospora hepatopenaei]